MTSLKGEAACFIALNPKTTPQSLSTEAASLDPTRSLPSFIPHIHINFDNPFLYSSILMMFVFVMPQIPTYPSRLSKNINSPVQLSHIPVWAPSFEISSFSSLLP